MQDFKFPFGSNDPYYSRREPESRAQEQAFGVAKLFGQGALLFGIGFLPRNNGGNVFDTYYKAARVLGHTTPMGLFASLRVPEMLSPFTSNQFKAGGSGVVTFGKEYLGGVDTLKYLSSLTGMDEAALQGHGIGSGAELTFEPASGWRGRFGQGRLVTTHKGSSTTLSDNIMLIERSHTIGEPFSPRTNINQFAEGVASVVADRVNVKGAFTATEGGKVVGAHRWMPAHSITGATSRISDMWKRVTYIRGFSAFAAQRPINALETMADNVPVFGESLQPLLKRVGWPRKTTATGSYLGLTGFAVKIAAAGMAVSQYNWWMR